jgi:flagellar basal-body rod protein FlgG
MIEGIYVAAAGATKQQRKLDVISNNLANLNNTGYKRDQLVFETLLTPFKEDLSLEKNRETLLPSSMSNDAVAYVGVSDFVTNHSQGPLMKTDNALNVALEGDGFFTVQTDAGIRYTRKGDFKLDNNRQLRTQSGDAVLDEKNLPINIPSGSMITIDNAGGVSVATGQGNVQVSKLKLVDFKDKSQLMKEGGGLYRMSDPKAIEATPTNTSVRQGFLEGSNVNSVEDMTNMVVTLRTFEAYQKVIQSIDRINNESVNNIGRVS